GRTGSPRPPPCAAAAGPAPPPATPASPPPSRPPPTAKTSEAGFAPLPKPPPRIRLRRQRPPLEPRSLRPAWLGAGDVALQEVPRGQLGVACGRRPVAAAPRQVHLHESSRRDQLLCLRVRRRHAVDAHHAVCAAATAEEARRR